ncbi:RmlC-like jelly roll fold [Syntrophomonas zehnderi OL-4]|uniref:RmlC-like jelly roll fold n=1 Tax=Syntrophomonas zehnderi OL-4 TaxID=690567 RepID=A0A0E3W2U9_9FIRM|nr:hypothetical protein [Syntrophomonas zehnderi]CFX22429.1 RmlC-like jelly roll fold [Syntrophomonas zehnderi OL-4]
MTEKGRYITDLPLETVPLGGYARTLIDNPQLRLVNLILNAGDEVLSHSAPVEVVFIVLKDSATVYIDDKQYSISEGQMLVCPPNTNRSIKAHDNGLSLLVIRAPNP